MGERGVTVDHTTLNRWVTRYSRAIEETARRRNKSAATKFFARMMVINGLPRKIVIARTPLPNFGPPISQAFQFKQRDPQVCDTSD